MPECRGSVHANGEKRAVKIATRFDCSPLMRRFGASRLQVVPANAIDLSRAESMRIGRKIWQNECGGTIAGLTSWNAGENFASLGIGHFIWYPKGVRGPFEESFPSFVRFVASERAHQRSFDLPKVLDVRRNKCLPVEFACRIPQRDELSGDEGTEELPRRTVLISRRTSWSNACNRRSRKCSPQRPPPSARRSNGNSSESPARPRDATRWSIMLTSKVKVVLDSERYHGQGWGLFQVLEGMTGNENGAGAAQEFARSARATLTRRVQNSPPERNESRWLPGWLQRVNSLRQELKHRERKIHPSSLGRCPDVLSRCTRLRPKAHAWARRGPALRVRQARGPIAPRPAAPAPLPPMRKASELISKQPPITINKGIYDSLSPDNAHVVVSLSKQRAYLLSGDQVAIDTPDFLRQTGRHDADRQVFGDGKGQGSSLQRLRRFRRSLRTHGSRRHQRRIDSAPSGTHYVGAPMKWFMRLTGEGVGMHVGILPGYPASHGCIRMPSQSAEMFYNRVKVGTPVVVDAVIWRWRLSRSELSREQALPQQFQRGLRRELLETSRGRSGKDGAAPASRRRRGERDKDVPTGFSAEPPPGPAMPVVARAKVGSCAAKRAFRHCRQPISLTAPCFSIKAGSTPSAAALASLA